MINHISKIIIKFVLLGAFAFVLTIYYGQISQAQTPLAEDILTAEEKLWIADHKNFKVANSEDWAPMTFLADGKPTGFSVDYLNMVAKKVGINLQYVNNGALNDLLGLMRSGEADLMHGISITPDRENYLDFTDEYLILPMANFGLSGSEPIRTLLDFDGKKVGLIDYLSTTNIYVSRYPDINFTLFETVDVGIANLSNGSVDVLIHTLPIINHAIAKNFIPGIEMIGDDILLDPEERDYLHLATRKGETTLLSILKKGMAAITVQEFTDLSNKWLMQSQKTYDIGLTKEEKDWLSQNKIIKIASSLTFNPMEYIDENGKHSGIASSFLDEISKRLNVDFIWSGNKSWNEGVEKIKSGEADILPLVTKTKERESFLTFTDVYMSFSHVIYAREGDHRFTTMDDLGGFSVAQAKGTAVINFIRKNYPDIKVVEVENTYESLRLLSTGQVDAYIGDIPSVTNAITRLGYSNIAITGTTTHSSSDAMGIRPDLPLLASAMQKALTDISPQRKNEILNEWISITNEIKPDYGLIWRLSIGVAAVFILILIWLNKLRLEINRRKEIEKALLISQKEAQKAQAEAERARDEKSLSLEELKVSEIRQKTLLELAPQAVIIFDAELNILYFNGNAQKTFCYKANEVRGKHLNILIPDAVHDIHAQHIKDFEKTNKVSLSMDQRSDIKAKRKNGELFPATASVAKITLEGENVYIVMLRDVTERVKANKLLIENKDRLSRAQKIAHIGNWEWNIVTNELMWSKEIYNIFGLKSLEFGETYDAFLERIHPDDREDVELAVINAVEKGSPYDITHRIICPDGTEKIVREIGEILRDDEGQPLRMDGTVQDITESWRNEQDLIESKTKAEQANAAKTQFLAVMSHELRTPLNAIIGFSSLIKDELYGDLGDEKYKEYAQDINTSGEHLLALIDDILDTSRIELDTIKPQFEYFAFDKIIDECVSLVDKKSIEKQVTIDVNIQENIGEVFLDPKLCKQIIINLLSNAAKFSRNDDRIYISLISNLETIELTVEDKGIGIDEEDLNIIFEPFMQANATYTRAYEGVGLGLTIVKRLTEIQNGSVSVTSKQGTGTCFKVILPMIAANE